MTGADWRTRPRRAVWGLAIACCGAAALGSARALTAAAAPGAPLPAEACAVLFPRLAAPSILEIAAQRRWGQRKRPVADVMMRLRGLRGGARGGRGRGKSRRPVPARDDSEASEDSSSATSGSMETGGGKSEDGMVRRDDIVTADQCVGHAEAAMEAGEFEDAVDFVQAALEDVADEYGQDAPERVPLLLLYARALIEMEAQGTADAARAGLDGREGSCESDDAGSSAPSEGSSEPDDEGSSASSGPEEAAHAAWRALEEARSIIRESSGRETKELATAHELQARFALDEALSCPALAGKTRAQRREIALEHLRICFAIRSQLFPSAHEEVARVRDKIALCEGPEASGGEREAGG